MRFGMIIALSVLVLLPASTVVAQSAPNARFLTVYGPATAPFGYLAFCDRYRADCRLKPGPRTVHLTSKRWDDLETINEVVNRTVAPTSDLSLYGTMERWDYPASAGDCEDYVLQKRRLLIGRGWPATALLITVVRDETGAGHAVLSVRTSSGDLVLDNRTDRVVHWHALPYDFVKRQSSLNPMSWVALTPRNDGLPSLQFTSSLASSHTAPAVRH